MKMKISICGVMMGAVLAMLLALASTPAAAQVSIGVQIGDVPVVSTAPQPECPYGYYDDPPYACAPMGFWGPEYFYNGIFIGAGPWFGWGYNHGWGEHRFHGYYAWHGHNYGQRGWGSRGGYHGGGRDAYRGGRENHRGGGEGYRGAPEGGHAAPNAYRGGAEGGHSPAAHAAPAGHAAPATHAAPAAHVASAAHGGGHAAAPAGHESHEKR